MTDLLLLSVPVMAEGARVRAQLRDWSRREGVPEPACRDAELVTSELFSNAVTATPTAERSTAQRPTAQSIEVRLAYNDRRLIVTVVNTGPGFDPNAVPPPDCQRQSGRGIAIARALGDVAVEQAGPRTTVRVALNDPG